jgi:hypothetical protein
MLFAHFIGRASDYSPPRAGLVMNLGALFVAKDIFVFIENSQSFGVWARQS